MGGQAFLAALRIVNGKLQERTTILIADYIHDLDPSIIPNHVMEKAIHIKTTFEGGLDSRGLEVTLRYHQRAH